MIAVVPTKRDKKRQQRTRKDDQRRQTEARRQRRERARARADAVAAAQRELASLAADPDRFVGRLSELLENDNLKEQFDEPGEAWFRGQMLAEEVGAESARVLADRLIAGPTDTTVPTDTAAVAWWAVGLYEGAGALARAEEVASRVAFTGDESEGFDQDVGWIVAHLRLEAGMSVKAADLARKICEADPDDPDGLEVLSTALGQLHEADQRDPAGEEALARFADRSRLERLRGALASFVERDRDLAAWVDAAQEEWRATFLEEAGTDGWDRLTGQHAFAADSPDGSSEGDEADTGLALMAAESIWTRGPDRDRRDHEPDAEDDSQSLLNRFAADPATPADLADLARDWQQMARYGLWQVADPAPSPGVWVTDLVTRRSTYAAMAPGHLEQVPRWSVLAGCLFPDHGIWRAGGAFALFDPSEGDRATEVALTAASKVMGALAEEGHIKRAASLRPAEPSLRDVPPYGVVAGLAEPVDQQLADLQAWIIGVAFPMVLGDAWHWRRRPPQMVNTDREPLELLKVTAPVQDPDGLRAALVRRPEFEVDPGDGSIVWQGREMTPLEAETSRARVEDWASDRGLAPVQPSDGPQRWIRGYVRIEEDVLSVEVNSRHRLETISRLLDKLGIRDLVVEQRFDPTLDLALPAGWRPLGDAGSAESEDVWRRHWLDEDLPALGTSPRQARHDSRSVVRLEGLLRQLEFDADLARFNGKRPIDVGKIRQQLADDDGRPFGL